MSDTPKQSGTQENQKILFRSDTTLVWSKLNTRSQFSLAAVAAWVFEAGKALQFRLWGIFADRSEPTDGIRLTGGP
jgi:hypothetical protein